MAKEKVEKTNALRLLDRMNKRRVGVHDRETALS